MVGKKRKKNRSKLLGSHQRCWMWGRHAVLETLRAGRWVPLEIHADLKNLADETVAEVRRIAHSLGAPVIDSGNERMTELCRSTEHQGLMAKMPPFPYASAETLLRAFERTNQGMRSAGAPFVLLLDGIQDPHNFGAILRSADAFGVQGVFVPSARQAEVTAHVVRSAAGAVNHLQIATVESLPGAADRLQEAGLRVIGATEKGALPPDGVDLQGGLALAIGNEGVGLTPDLLDRCTQLVRIPQLGHVSSLNAAVAAGILCYEVQRQRSSGRAETGPVAG